MAGKETTKSESGSLVMQAEQREEDLGANEKAEQKNLNQDLGAEEEQREEGRSTNDRIEQQDLNQGMDTGTSSSTHRGVNWGPGYHVRSTANDKIRGHANQAVHDGQIAVVENKEAFRASVARRAYGLYLGRGGNHGRDVEDWLKAEKELSPNPVTDSAKSDKGQNKASWAN